LIFKPYSFTFQIKIFINGLLNLDFVSTKQIEIGSLKVGTYIVLEGVACTVKSLQVSSPGKHGHAKYRIEAVAIIGGQKKIFIAPKHDKIDSPIIDKELAQVISVSGDKANVMDLKTYETFDIDIPNELKDEVKEGVNVAYWRILDDKIMKQVRSD
jgi:translation initiation factor 5A